jgi:hypothetical protein
MVVATIASKSDKGQQELTNNGNSNNSTAPSSPLKQSCENGVV